MRFKEIGLIIISGIVFFSCQNAVNQTPDRGSVAASAFIEDGVIDSLEVATFTGGHFYALETAFEQVKGVEKVLTGFVGGKQAAPSFDKVLKGETKHQLGVQVYFNPKKITYVMLLAIYFAAHDPTSADRQGIETGLQFSPNIYYHDEQQKVFATQQVEKESKKSKYRDQKIVTGIQAYNTFWVAPEAHQNFAVNHKDDEYVIKVVKPYLKVLEKKYGAWMLKAKALFPENDDQPKEPSDSRG